MGQGGFGRDCRSSRGPRGRDTAPYQLLLVRAENDEAVQDYAQAMVRVSKAK